MELNPVNLTINTLFSGKFYLQNLYELLPCFSVPKFIFKEKVNIPFFGINGIIISIKSEKWGSRGVRCQTVNGEYSGSLKNCISIDVQLFDKNFNVKIFESKYHIGGINDVKISEELSKTLNSIILNTEQCWEPFFKLSYNERIEFIKLIYDISLASNIEDEFNKYSFNELDYAARSSLAFLDFYSENFMEKLNKIASLNVINDSILYYKYPMEIKFFE